MSTVWAENQKFKIKPLRDLEFVAVFATSGCTSLCLGHPYASIIQGQWFAPKKRLKKSEPFALWFQTYMPPKFGKKT